MPYCKICRAKKIEEWTGFFEEKTGEREMRWVCSRNPCHDGHTWEPLNEGNWLVKLLGIAPIGSRCKICGERMYYAGP